MHRNIDGASQHHEYVNCDITGHPKMH